MEERKILSESQSGFRRGRSTIDNIFILNHLAQKERKRAGKEAKVYALFVDLKATFDNVERETLWEILLSKRVDKSLIARIKKIYEETDVVIRTKEGFIDKFSTKKGVRQGYVISPLLFNVYIAGIDKEMEDRGIRNIAIGNTRVWTIAYADDIVVLAKNREALLDMMSTLGKFLKKRKLELGTEKTKMVVFNRNRKEKREVWK